MAPDEALPHEAGPGQGKGWIGIGAVMRPRRGPERQSNTFSKVYTIGPWARLAGVEYAGTPTRAFHDVDVRL